LHARSGSDGLGASHVLPLKQKLPVQVGHFYGIKIDDGDVSKARKYDILEQLTPNASGANDKKPTTGTRIHS
jgi:hypothetical protein